MFCQNLKLHHTFKAVWHLNEHIMHQVLLWPKGEEAISVMRGFEAIAGMPGVLGTRDGSYIKVKAPLEVMMLILSYLNRLRYHSIILQAVCDNEMPFTNCHTG